MTEKIVGFINCQGFQHGKNYSVREMAFIANLAGATPLVYQVDGVVPPDCQAAARSYSYQKFNHHGLSLYPPAHIPRIKQEDLIPTIRHLYQNVGGKGVLAFKNGFMEKDLLTNAGIPFVNLETYSCPCFHTVTETHSYESCGHHSFSKFGYLNCAGAKVRFYRDFILDQL